MRNAIAEKADKKRKAIRISIKNDFIEESMQKLHAFFFKV
ncbi:hypothetical protein B14911_11102 [Bacillus sp. NRRL B-14911]|uniref:Uncharacterized protein n=1 Tax=Bacillus infantis NRRL B-14911 TaxID=1367477 RepID=U5L7A3_9BACI|nr:hypothetical protein N288_08835 [Bacillus infantis NRRL B-14911]EAR64807.1 hypothetical protein B14911_11102 [Bacillus sp. NRRL B-14911]